MDQSNTANTGRFIRKMAFITHIMEDVTKNIGKSSPPNLWITMRTFCSGWNSGATRQRNSPAMPIWLALRGEAVLHLCAAPPRGRGTRRCRASLPPTILLRGISLWGLSACRYSDGVQLPESVCGKRQIGQPEKERPICLFTSRSFVEKNQKQEQCAVNRCCGQRMIALKSKKYYRIMFACSPPICIGKHGSGFALLVSEKGHKAPKQPVKRGGWPESCI